MALTVDEREKNIWREKSTGLGQGYLWGARTAWEGLEQRQSSTERREQKLREEGQGASVDSDTYSRWEVELWEDSGGACRPSMGLDIQPRVHDNTAMGPFWQTWGKWLLLAAGKQFHKFPKNTGFLDY